ncbi:MAG: TlyA family RNA methyltransferase [bacterium]|nr:TlyA family RNA methyltransferase [bacterium]
MKKQNKKLLRADELAVKQNLVESLSEAKKMILAGFVRIGSDRVIYKCNELLDSNVSLNINQPCPYVSRGAYKLKPAFDKYLNDLSGKVAADIGASTGGFTDLMLQYGIEKVYAIDVGHSQLHYKLRNIPQVINMEKLNAKNMTTKTLPELIDIVTMDVSFISVIKVLPAVNKILKSNGWSFILIKPQFEAERNEIEHGGVVRDVNIRKKYVDKVVSFAKNILTWSVLDILPSPIKGPKGNQEFIMVSRKNDLNSL